MGETRKIVRADLQVMPFGRHINLISRRRSLCSFAFSVALTLCAQMGRSQERRRIEASPDGAADKERYLSCRGWIVSRFLETTTAASSQKCPLTSNSVRATRLHAIS